MNSVPFLYVNIIAVSLYTLFFTAFLMAKKTPENRSFLYALAAFILWTGGSILMRLQVFPGISFWFYVSIVSMFSTPLFLFFFVHSFTNARGRFLIVVWSVSSGLIMVLTAMGVFLKPPIPQVVNGGTVFLYKMEWPIVIPCIFFACVIASIFQMVRSAVRQKGIRSQGLMSIILGLLAMGVGNMVQIIPGNTFPWDTLSGILFALFLVYALYKKRMFRLTLLVSKSVLLVVSAIICFVLAIYLVSPMEAFVSSRFQFPDSSQTALVVTAFAILLVIFYTFLKWMINLLFTRDREKKQLLRDFSQKVSHTLLTHEIVSELVSVVREEIAVPRIYVCLPEEEQFVPHEVNPLDTSSFSIDAKSVYVNYLRHGDSLFLMRDFRHSPMNLSVLESEKLLFSSLDIQCVVALKDGEDITGLMLLPSKERGQSYTQAELEMLDTVASIASIAIKNAILYERVYREARIDNLTGVYNYKFFLEKMEEEYAACKNENLALVFLDVDDLKLYNQLYGAREGDQILKTIAGIITRVVHNAGTVFRYSGKTFAVILPHYDARQTYLLAAEVQRQLRRLNRDPEQRVRKELTLSGGICVSPYAAGSVKELIENADLATFNAKNSGKGKIYVFKNASPESQRISERALEIIERTDRGDANLAYSSTVFALTAAIDAKDHYTYNHSRNVAYYSIVLATAVGLNDDQVRLVYEAALLHDIGKISVPEMILCKPSELDNDEFELMKSHVNNSIEMIRHLPNMDYVIPVAIAHHERWDGKGYPRGIKGDEIPIGGRCLAIADAFDAMTTDRPYRKGVSFDEAARQIEMGAGRQFDPQLAEIFVKLVRTGEINVESSFSLV